MDSVFKKFIAITFRVKGAMFIEMIQRSMLFSGLRCNLIKKRERQESTFKAVLKRLKSAADGTVLFDI